MARVLLERLGGSGKAQNTICGDSYYPESDRQSQKTFMQGMAGIVS